MWSGGGTEADLTAFSRAFQVSFPILRGAWNTYVAYRQSGSTSPYPLDYVIDQAGNVAYFNTEYAPEAMVAVIDHLLAHPAEVDSTPRARALSVAAHPNPFNPRTEMVLSLPRSSSISVDIHDPRGRRVRRLVRDAFYPAGDHTVVWDGTDAAGRALPAGLYLVRVQTDRAEVTGKLTLVR